MIEPKLLLNELTRLLKRVEDDLRERALSPTSDVPELRGRLQAEWQGARDAERTAETFESWAEQVITQAGVHWLLSCVFLRFIEDNELVDRPWISGTPQSGRMALARDRHDAYFREHPHENDRDYMLACFREAGALPGLHTFFDEAHNPLFRLGISGDAAMAVMKFWQEVAADSGNLVRDFTDEGWNTRFLGDLYQDLSEATRKRFALLQTPEFVEEFILDRTLTPAIQEFGYSEVRMIDPTCGSGHFLLGGFHRMVDEWSRNEPGRNRRDVAQKALDAVSGVDLNPFAVAIARFRLLVAALQACDVRKLGQAPDFRVSVAIGDSLLHGRRFGLTATEEMFSPAEYGASSELIHAYGSEDLAEVQRLLSRQYHAVVGNPPYIVVKDAALNSAYRARYASCHRQYSLGAPFTERFFDLAITGASKELSSVGGFVGLITTNSFMKREFGRRLIEDVLPRLDLTHVIDTQGAFIPGHGTPTVILLGRHRKPVNNTVRTVMGIKGEPSPPDDAAKGLVWSAILNQIDLVGSESNYISVTDTLRTALSRHPWSIGGGGAAELKELLEKNRVEVLDHYVDAMGFFQDTHADDVFIQPSSFFGRMKALPHTRPCIRGDGIRDWHIAGEEAIFFPYDQSINQWTEMPQSPPLRWVWSFRTTLWGRSVFGGKTYREVGRPWWDYHQFPKGRARAKRLIAFSEIATHNHFVLNSGALVFNRTAPVIKLRSELNEQRYIGLLGVLNSSVACFWLKQVCHNKGEGGGTRVDAGNSALGDEAWKSHFSFNSTKVAAFPVVDNLPFDICTNMIGTAEKVAKLLPSALVGSTVVSAVELPTRAVLDSARATVSHHLRLLIAQQEELDWRSYRHYGLLPNNPDAANVEYAAPIEIGLGERAFEIVLARRVAAGDEETGWFGRHRSTPLTDIPGHWPEEYRRVVEHRIHLITNDRNIGLIERPEFKRRWNSPSWNSLEQTALSDWLLARIESPTYWQKELGQHLRVRSTRSLADQARKDSSFMQIAELYVGHSTFNLETLVAELVASESVPFIPVQRYTETGLRKQVQWQKTWALQRHEDTIDAEIEATAIDKRERLITFARKDVSADRDLDADSLRWVETTVRAQLENEKKERKAREIGEIPVPPKYQSKDFLKSDYWRLRGALDVPKERWVSYPGCERSADGSLVIAWAGWDHLQHATAVATYFLDMKEQEGWSADRLQPLLAGLLELLPWLKQWHNEMNLEYGARMGDYYEAFVIDEARALGFTLDDLRGWKPAPTATKRARKKAA